MLTVTAVAAVVSMAGYVIFARPMIVLGATHVRVRNPLSDRVFARGDITDAKRGWMYPRVVVDGRPIRLMALEQSTWQSMQGHLLSAGSLPPWDPRKGMYLHTWGDTEAS